MCASMRSTCGSPAEAVWSGYSCAGQLREVELSEGTSFLGFERFFR